jgi:hypothetical protein
MLAITICFNIVHWVMFVRMEQASRRPRPPPPLFQETQTPFFYVFVFAAFLPMN